ncbi:hypothetical protein D3C75_1155930 [compost metagenome]
MFDVQRVLERRIHHDFSVAFIRRKFHKVATVNPHPLEAPAKMQSQSTVKLDGITAGSRCSTQNRPKDSPRSRAGLQHRV